MDRIAIISDVHGNIPALETVLADIRQRGIDTIYCLGDLVGKGPQSDEAVDMCRETCVEIVRGNWDATIGDCSLYPDSAHINWQRQQLGQERLDWLLALPNTIDLTISGKRVRLFHASHISEWHRVLVYESYETHLAMFQNTSFTGEDTNEPDVVGYGDIHVPFMTGLHRHHKMLFNAGSVGNPLDIPMTCYTILSGELDRTEGAPFLLDFVRLPYDIEKAAMLAQQAQMPETRPYVGELRTAIHRSRLPRSDQA